MLIKNLKVQEIIMVPFILLLGGEVNYDVMSFEYSLKGLPIKTETIVTSTHVDYFDLDLPLVIRDESMDNTLVSRKEETLGIGLSVDHDYGYPDISNPSDVYTSSDGYSTLSDINVSPNGGDTQTVFRFTITYTDTLNRAPKSGFPKLHVSNENWVEDKRSYTMQQSNPSDTNYADGKEYFLELSYDKIGIYYFYFEVETPTDTVETDQYQLVIDELSIEEKWAGFWSGMVDSMFLATSIITALGIITVIPSSHWENIAAMITFGTLIIWSLASLINCMTSRNPITPFYSFGWFLGLMISAGLFTAFCKASIPLEKVKENIFPNLFKFIVVLFGQITNGIFGSLNTLSDFEIIELQRISIDKMAIQLSLLTIACWFSSALIFGAYNEGAEDLTKMVAIVSMMSFTIFGILFLITTFGGT